MEYMNMICLFPYVNKYGHLVACGKCSACKSLKVQGKQNEVSKTLSGQKR